MKNRIGRGYHFIWVGERFRNSYHSETFYDVRFVRYLYKTVLVKIFFLGGGGGGSEGGSRRYGL